MQALSVQSPLVMFVTLVYVLLPVVAVVGALLLIGGLLRRWKVSDGSKQAGRKLTIWGVVLLTITALLWAWYWLNTSTTGVSGDYAIELFDTSGAHCEQDIECSCAKLTRWGDGAGRTDSVCDQDTSTCEQCVYQ